jgi:hypothetical protein
MSSAEEQLTRDKSMTDEEFFFVLELTLSAPFFEHFGGLMPKKPA